MPPAPMQYHLRTLMFVLAISPPLIGLVFARLWIVGWTAFIGLFVLWYWQLLEAQALDPRTRGG
jgi:hypothetical protein